MKVINIFAYKKYSWPRCTTLLKNSFSLGLNLNSCLTAFHQLFSMLASEAVSKCPNTFGITQLKCNAAQKVSTFVKCYAKCTCLLTVNVNSLTFNALHIMQLHAKFICTFEMAVLL